MRHVYIDLGANVGKTLIRHAQENPDCELYAVEPNLELMPKLFAVSSELGRAVSMIWAAAWIRDGRLRLFGSGRSEASTIVQGKLEYEAKGWPQINYAGGTEVPCFDFSSWLFRNFRKEDNVIIKMDIEGAEYQVLTKMLIDGSIDIPRKIICEWHQDRFPHLSTDEHNMIKSSVAGRVDLEDWI